MCDVALLLQPHCRYPRLSCPRWHPMTMLITATLQSETLLALTADNPRQEST